MWCGRGQRWLPCTVGDLQSHPSSTAAHQILVSKHFHFLLLFGIFHKQGIHPICGLFVLFVRTLFFCYLTKCTITLHVTIILLLNQGGAKKLAYLFVMFILLNPSSGDELWPPAERLIPPPAAGSHGRVPAHEDAQEDPGAPVICVLRDLRQDGTTHLHGKKRKEKNNNCSVCVCACGFAWTSGTVPLLGTIKGTSRRTRSPFQAVHEIPPPTPCVVSSHLVCAALLQAVLALRLYFPRRESVPVGGNYCLPAGVRAAFSRRTRRRRNWIKAAGK